MINQPDILQRKLQQIATDLLSSGTVDCVIGYVKDSFQEWAIPAIINHPSETQQLVWNETCIHNLAVLIKTNKPSETQKQAIILKGCDIRTVIVLFQEKQINRKYLKIIGIDCAGVIDRAGNQLLKCNICHDKHPPLYDYLIENPTFESVNIQESLDIQPLLHEIESLPLRQRLHFWKQQAEKCIRCYACREICPLCYCPECFTEHNLPQYIPITPSLKGNFSWLILRAFDLAGRCTGCMECDRVCPQKIPLHLLNQKVAQDVKELFQYEAGYDPDIKPFFTLVKEEDSNIEIL